MGVKRVRRQNNDGTKIVRPAGSTPGIHSLPRRAPSPAAGPQIRAFFRKEPGQAEKKTKKLRKSSCGFSAIRIDHGHRRDGHLTRFRERAISSVGRAPRLHRGCREFESLIAHHFPSFKLLMCLRCGACRSVVVTDPATKWIRGNLGNVGIRRTQSSASRTVSLLPLPPAKAELEIRPGGAAALIQAREPTAEIDEIPKPNT